MGEISKNAVIVLAVAVIVVSALGTWAVLNATSSLFGGLRIPVSQPSQPIIHETLRGSISVNVNGEMPPPAAPVPAAPEAHTMTGMVSVYVND